MSLPVKLGKANVFSAPRHEIRCVVGKNATFLQRFWPWRDIHEEKRRGEGEIRTLLRGGRMCSLASRHAFIQANIHWAPILRRAHRLISASDSPLESACTLKPASSLTCFIVVFSAEMRPVIRDVMRTPRMKDLEPDISRRDQAARIHRLVLMQKPNAEMSCFTAAASFR